MVEVTVARLGLDSSTNSYVVILQEKGGSRLLPIWIGQPEAESIAMHINSIKRDRHLGAQHRAERESSTTRERRSSTHKLNLPKSSGRRFSRYSFNCSALSSSALLAGSSSGVSISSSSSASTAVRSASCA